MGTFLVKNGGILSEFKQMAWQKGMEETKWSEQKKSAKRSVWSAALEAPREKAGPSEKMDQFGIFLSMS